MRKNIQLIDGLNFFKLFCICMLLLCVNGTIYAQNGMNFQGVARNANGIILASQPITVRLSIIQGSSSGNILYQETKTVTTNAQGIFNIVIGDPAGATNTTGSYTNIAWQTPPHFIRLEMDPSAGTNFAVLGTTQLQYVAYAQFANGVAAENIVGLVPVARGGTGASNLQDLKQNLQLNNVNNTSDLNKPISTATQNVLNEKLNVTDTVSLSSRINLKVNISDSSTIYITPTQLNNAFLNLDTSHVYRAIASKESLSNKSTATDLGGDHPSDILYPTQKAVKAYLTSNNRDQTITLTGDVIGTGTGTFTSTLVNTGVIAGSYGSGNSVPVITIDAKGRITNVSTSAVSGTWSGGVLDIEHGGTGLVASGTNGQVLTSTGSGTYTHTNISSIAVPYSGATNAVDLGLFDLKVNGLSIGLGGNSIESNLIVGKDALNSNLTGENNIGFGKFSLNQNTNGNANIGIGSSALRNNLIGNGNIALGFNTLISSTIENNNIAIGNNTDIDYDVENSIIIGNGAVIDQSNSMKIGADDTFEQVKTSGIIKSSGINPTVNLNSAYIFNNSPSEGDLYYFNQDVIDALGMNYAYIPGYYYWSTSNQFLPIWYNNLNSNQYYAGNGIQIDNFNSISTVQDISITGNPTLRSLKLINGDDLNSSNNLEQISFGWNGNPSGIYNDGNIEYAHAIKTRHNSAASFGNNIDFFTWDPITNNSASEIGNKHIMTLQGDGKVGIGTRLPLHTLDVNGSIYTTGNLIAGAVVYPNTVGSNQNNQVLTSYTDGTIGWSDFVQGQNNINLGSAAYSQTTDFELPLTFNAPFSRTGNLINIQQSNATTSGYLSSTDWNIFNNKQNTLIQDVDYLRPNGSAADLTNFPILNQNTSGNAQTATKLLNAKKINGTSFDGTTDINIIADAGTLSGTTLASNVVNSQLSSIGTLTSGAIPYSLLIGNVPIWNQNTTGNAFTATLAGNITATTNSTLTSLPNLTTTGVIANGTWQGNIIAVTYGGTGTNSSTGTGSVVLSNAPTLVNPILGNASATSVSIGSSVINTSAILEVSSNSKGFLPPRMTASQRNAINSPSQGLIIYCTNCGIKGELNVFNGSEWTLFDGSNTTTPIDIGSNYGGGIVTYIFQEGDIGFIRGQLHGLIVATSDIVVNGNTSFPWNNGSFVANTSTLIGTGLTNTEAIISNQGVGNYAAYLARNFNANSYTDWYLPSRDELNIIFSNSSISGVSISQNYYWTSSDAGSYAYWQFPGYNSAQWFKSGLGRVRPIRSF